MELSKIWTSKIINIVQTGKDFHCPSYLFWKLRDCSALQDISHSPDHIFHSGQQWWQILGRTYVKRISRSDRFIWVLKSKSQHFYNNSVWECTDILHCSSLWWRDSLACINHLKWASIHNHRSHPANGEDIWIFWPLLAWGPLPWTNLKKYLTGVILLQYHWQFQTKWQGRALTLYHYHGNNSLWLPALCPTNINPLTQQDI
jgi:hypothetical protein